MAGSRAEFSLVLNGQSLTVEGIAPQVTLLDFVRSRGLTGAKEGCAEGECGACAMLVGGPDGVRAVNSCLIPLPAVAGCQIRTVEGLADQGRLVEAQAAMMALGGSQCGYCTPGFVVSMVAAQCAGASRDPHLLGGNLCRCTGYRPIAEAFRGLGAGPSFGFGEVASALDYAVGAGRFSRPLRLADCFGFGPTARFVCGNTDLGIETNLRGVRFAELVSLDAVAELREFRDGPDAVEIGAALTLSEMGERWTSAPAIFREWLGLFASPLIRNRATLGGNLATASPIGDGAPMLMALDASVRIASAGGERLVPLSEFFVGYRQTVLRAGELLRSVVIPKPICAGARFFKVAKRRLDDISTVAAGIAIGRDSARIVFGGVAAIPLRVQSAEIALIEHGLEPAQAVLRRVLKPIGDHRGSAAYRLAMAQSLLEKAYEQRSA